MHLLTKRSRLWHISAILVGILLVTGWIPQAAPAPAALGPSASHPLTDPIVIDGVFSGALIDGDGSLTSGIGAAHPTKFIEQKKFDAADNVYYVDMDGDGFASAGDDYWLDNGDGTYGAGDAVIVGAPIAGAVGTRVDALAGETAIAYNDAEIDDNNYYDDGEDIYLVDSAGEFRGAMQRIIADPLNPGQALAHIYIASVTDTVFMHNDFIIDTEAVWIDGDGAATTGPGVQTEIGFMPFTNTISSTLSVQLFGHWFDSNDNVYWKSTGPFSDTWSAMGDALWLDANDDGVYNSGADKLIISTGALNDGEVGRELNSDSLTPTYNFTYNDENGNNQWDSGEDIATLDGDEVFDWNYFDDRWSWLVDGDGDITDGRGIEDETRIDGNTWFQASDHVHHWDANANGDWNKGDGLWIDDDGDGTFTLGSDRVLVRGTMSGGESGKLLETDLVDADGTITIGAGAENTARRGQSAFNEQDNVFWCDVQNDDNWFWSSGDGLWIDDDGDGIFNIGSDRVLVLGTMSGGESGIRLSASAHHFGYDDGEVALNGRYDPGEDIYAANTYLAYDDLEISFNNAYDPGEDIYDRDYIEIWVYAEGDAAQVPTDMLHPDLEPNLRDVGFRVHVNGIRVDDPADDYDAPTGFQAAAGWGASRGALTFAPAGVYNRHYEYKLPSAAAGAPLHVVSNGERVDVLDPTTPAAPRVWETDHKIDWQTCEMTWITHWKDLRRGRDDFRGFGSSSGQREESVMLDWLHPPPPPPPDPPIVIKEPLLGPIFGSSPFVENYCWSIFVYNPGEQDLGEIELRDHLPPGWNGYPFQVNTHPPGIMVEILPGTDGPVIVFPDGLPAGGWVEIVICANGPLEPTAEELVNYVEGDVDDDQDPTTPPVPVPGDGARVPVITEPDVWLFKWPEETEVERGKSVTWHIGIVNTGKVAVDDAKLQDALPDGLKVKTQSGTLPAGEDVTLPLDTVPRGGVRIVGLETEVKTTVTPSTTLTNTLALQGEFSVPLFGGFSLPYSTTVSASIHVTGPVDIPAPVVITGEHSTLTTFDGHIRDDELADFVCSQIPKDGNGVPLVKDVKIMFNSCYGGGMLDDFERVFGPGGACEGVPWVGGAASGPNQVSWGPSDAGVNANPGTGDYWTNALADAVSNGGNVQESFEDARDNDVRGPNGNPHKEDPVVASGNGGGNIEWNAPGTKHEAVVFGGKNTNLRHHNDIQNMSDALDWAWDDGYHIRQGWGDAATGTKDYLKQLIISATQNLDANTQLVLYFDDHGDTDFDFAEFMGWSQPRAAFYSAVAGTVYTISSPLSVTFSLHPGWVEGLTAMDQQAGDVPSPTLNLTLGAPINPSQWSITLNSVAIPLPTGTPSGALELAVEWTSIQSGTNRLDIAPVGTPGGPMVLNQLELSSGPINQRESDLGWYIYLPLVLR